MRVPFRQGLVRYQTDIANNPTFLAPSGSTVNLVVSPDPTIINFAHREANYLFEEKISITGAWQGPFSAGNDYWLYFDIDLLTGLRSFGHTTLEPVYSQTAPASVTGQHWFDLKENLMKFFNGTAWQECIRVFAAKYDEGTVMVPYPIGSQVGLLQVSYPGFIMFDDEENPVRKFRRGRRSEFLTTESVLATHLSTGAINFAFETALHIVQAVEPIPEYYLITSKGIDQVGVASHLNQTSPIIGMVREDVSTGQFITYVPRGVVTHEEWNWNVSPGTPLFCGATGQVTLSVPQSGTIQQIGYVLTKKTIFLDTGHMIVLEGA